MSMGALWPLELTKWFGTNCHHFVPEIGVDANLRPLRAVVHQAAMNPTDATGDWLRRCRHEAPATPGRGGLAPDNGRG